MGSTLSGNANGPGLGSQTHNKGHVVNAGLLYILESGLMKLLSTTGALLVEKNIAFDINPESGVLNGDDELAGIISSSNPEDMFITLLTKKGKLIKYTIQLERQFDES